MKFKVKWAHKVSSVLVITGFSICEIRKQGGNALSDFLSIFSFYYRSHYLLTGQEDIHEQM